MFYHFRNLALHKATVESNTTLYSENNIFLVSIQIWKKTLFCLPFIEQCSNCSIKYLLLLVKFLKNKSLFSSVQFSRSVMSGSSWPPWTAARQASLSITDSRSLQNSRPSSQWCHPTISSSGVPSSFCLQSFPASGSFLVSQLFTSGGQRMGASASVLLWRSAFFMVQPSHPYMTTGKTITLTIWDLCWQSNVSAF